jgi:hypothetical protein
MGFQLGLVLLVLACLAAYALIAGWIGARRATAAPAGAATYQTVHQGDKHPDQRLYFMLFFLVAAVAILFATTPQAATLWQLVPLLEIIQFPWRLLAPAALSLSIVGGLVVCYFGAPFATPHPQAQRLDSSQDPEWIADTGMLLLALIIVLASFDYSRPTDLQPVEAWREDGRAVAEFEAEHPDMYGYTQYVEEPFTASPMRDQYLAALEEKQPLDSNELTRFVITSGEGEILTSYGLGHSFGGTVEMETAGTVQIQLLAFPGWRVNVDGFVVDPRVSDPYGLMEIDLPAGFHTIELWMGFTRTRSAGALISGVALLLLVGLWWVGQRSRRTVDTA